MITVYGVRIRWINSVLLEVKDQRSQDLEDLEKEVMKRYSTICKDHNNGRVMQLGYTSFDTKIRELLDYQHYRSRVMEVNYINLWMSLMEDKFFFNYTVILGVVLWILG